MFESVENLFYVIWIRRLKPVHNIRIVNGRPSSRYGVRDFGFCDFNSPDIFRRAAIIPRAIVTKLVYIGFTFGTLQNTDANLRVPFGVTTNLFQRVVEVTLVLPVNVFRTFLLISNLHTVRCDAWDEWKAAAADGNDHDYAEYNKPESSRWSLHSERWFDSARGNYQA